MGQPRILKETISTTTTKINGRHPKLIQKYLLIQPVIGQQRKNLKNQKFINALRQ